MNRSLTCRSRAFSLIELLVVIAIIALLISILLPALAAARRTARLSVCQSSLQQHGRAQYAYGAEFKDYIAAFNGRAEDLFAYNELHALVFPTHTDCGSQALEIVQERDSNAADLVRFATPANNAPIINESHSHLVLADYIGDGRAIMPVAACPEDRARLSWQREGAAGTPVTNKPQQPWNQNNERWLPYSSSYQLMPAGWTQDRPTGQIGVAFGQSNYHSWYVYDRKPEPLGRRKFAEIAFPAMKVAIADSQQRHFGRDMYFGYPDVRQPLLFWDSSVSVRRTGDANKGWDRRNHRQTISARFSYFPDLAFESPVPVGRPGIITAGYYKWTRGGLSGIDYGGNEPNTTNW